MRFRYTRHAVQRIMERGIAVEKVEALILSGSVINRYEDGMPFPSYLVLGFDDKTPWHAVYSIEKTEIDAVVHVITVYQPSPLEWDSSFTKRKAVE